MTRLPTYEYRCDSCEKNFDVVQSFHDDPLTACPTCGSPVRKVFGNVGIVFKGSGFYKTDSRPGARQGSDRGRPPRRDPPARRARVAESATPAATSTGDRSLDHLDLGFRPRLRQRHRPPKTPAKTSSKESGS